MWSRGVLPIFRNPDTFLRRTVRNLLLLLLTCHHEEPEVKNLARYIRKIHTFQCSSYSISDFSMLPAPNLGCFASNPPTPINRHLNPVSSSCFFTIPVDNLGLPRLAKQNTFDNIVVSMFFSIIPVQPL